MPSTPSAPVPLEFTSVAFFGRTFQEYLHFFGLSRARLRGIRTLDVGAGPSSFVAEAHGLGIEAVAVDPLYGLPVDALRGHVEIDYARMISQMRKKAENFRFRYFPSIDAAEATRREAARRFLADYEEGFLHNRYVGGALPALPFCERSFEMVLCAHLLFLYQKQFDYEWHLAACRELVRLSEGEVRIHPICGLDGRPYEPLERLLTELALEGIEGRVIDVDYEFFAGSGKTLVLARRG